MILTAAVISDIHFGAIKPNVLYNELKTQFLDFIKDRYIDMIVICGDFYNSIISLNSQTALTSFDFMNELVDICEKNGIKYIRIIEGTLSHDNYQILNFRMHESNTKVNFRVITKTCAEVIEDNITILYIPEEYVSDHYNHYKRFLVKDKKYYDLIFGHGMFKETSFAKEDGETQISRAPIWNSKLLSSLCKGPIFFGHIHTSQVIRKHIYYTGSFSRWVYGQEEPKGFYIFAYDTESHKYIAEFIENKLARLYDTMIVHLSSFKGSIDSLVNIIKNKRRDHLRIKVLIENTDRDLSYDLSILREYFSGKPLFKIDIIDMRQKEKQRELEERVNKLFNDYDFIFDKSIPIEIKLYKFIKRKYNKDMSIEKIKSILNNEKIK